MVTNSYHGFSPETLKFLRDLKRNNDRDWFARHRERYETHVLAPSLAYIEAMRSPLQKVSPLFQAVPKKVGGSLMRIYRDTRFSKDKSPYKTNIGIQFRHEAGVDIHAPGFYLHIAPGECFFAVGMWHPAPEALAAVRKAIAAQPVHWKKARDHRPFRSRFRLAGDSLQRPPRGTDPNHPCVDDLRRKDHIGVQPLEEDLIVSRDLVRESVAAFQAARPYTRFLCEAVGVGF